ncbi:hypothetical protein BDN70DRAFT_835642 [Pholiota conissans]|uniref:Uncharacterized protein n=1 Tax=Pholiota conissans TaxID=109636 RepID=A0A9P6D0H8_9AGAR|nr:hypothetical protein BDN70DRAFT_835642 [Pholiota conissans]
MLLLLSLLLSLSRGAPLSPASTLPYSESGGHALLTLRETISESNDRTIWDIIWSCAATILACTWTALHPNIPGPYDSGWRCLKRRVVMTFYAIIAPEVVALWALIQWTGARNAMNDFNATIAKRQPPKKTILQSLEDWFFSTVPLETEEPGIDPWTMSHAFFGLMGGFLLYDEGTPIQVLTYSRLKQCIVDGTIDPPDITEDEIQDRSKGDFIGKGLLVLQTTWFILQCIARWVQKLPLSELEVVTLGYALLNGITYTLWWHKPQDAGKAFRVIKKKNTEKCGDEPSVGGLTKGVTESPPILDAKSTARVAATAEVSQPCSSSEDLKIGAHSRAAADPQLDDIKLQDPDGIPENPSLPAAQVIDVEKPRPMYVKVRYLRRRLRLDHSKVNGTWSSVVGFYAIMIPFRLFCFSLYSLLKMLDPEPKVEDGALRVSIFGTDAIEDSEYGGILSASCVVGTLFGAVHLIAWWSAFPTLAEHTLWRISTVYITGYPAFVLSAVIVVVVLSEYCGFKHLENSPLVFLIYNIFIWTGAVIYGLSRSVILCEAVLSLRNEPPAVYQDVEWIVFIPHL